MTSMNNKDADKQKEMPTDVFIYKKVCQAQLALSQTPFD